MSCENAEQEEPSIMLQKFPFAALRPVRGCDKLTVHHENGGRN